MNKERIGIGLGITLLAGGLLAAPVRSAELKIGAIDIQKAVNECISGKEAKTALAKEVEKFQRLIVERQKELQEMRESLEKLWPMLNQEMQTLKEKEYQAKLRDFQRWGEDSQKEIDQKRMEMERNISMDLQKVIQKLGAEEGYTLILEENEAIALFTSKAIDITDRVITIYDALGKQPK